MQHNGRIGSFAMLFAPPHRSYGARVRVGPQWQEAGSRMPMVRNAGKGVQSIELGRSRRSFYCKDLSAKKIVTRGRG